MPPISPALTLLILLATATSFVQTPALPAIMQTVPTQSRHPLPTLTIAHAFGGLDGKAYLNCQECFEFYYQRGYRYFEADLWMASDGRIVFMHDGQEKRLELPSGFTSQQFMARRLAGKYTPVDALTVAHLMRVKPDWYLVSDVKTSNEQALRALCKVLARENIDCRERVIPEIYHFQEIDMIQRLHFGRCILALYRMQMVRKRSISKLLSLAGRNLGITDEDIVRFVARHPEIIAVAMSDKDWRQPFSDQLKQVGAQTFVYCADFCVHRKQRQQGPGIFPKPGRHFYGQPAERTVMTNRASRLPDDITDGGVSGILLIS